MHAQRDYARGLKVTEVEEEGAGTFLKHPSRGQEIMQFGLIVDNYMQGFRVYTVGCNVGLCRELSNTCAI